MEDSFDNRLNNEINKSFHTDSNNPIDKEFNPPTAESKSDGGNAADLNTGSNDHLMT